MVSNSFFLAFDLLARLRMVKPQQLRQAISLLQVSEFPNMIWHIRDLLPFGNLFFCLQSHRPNQTHFHILTLILEECILFRHQIVILILVSFLVRLSFVVVLILLVSAAQPVYPTDVQFQPSLMEQLLKLQQH